MSRFRTLLHPATGIAILALVVSLGSGAVAAGLITGADIKDNSVTGADVKEPSLGKVPKATNADKVGGVQVKKIRYVKTGAQSKSTILNLNGLILKASCDGELVTLTANTTSDDAELNYSSIDTGNNNADVTFSDSFASGSEITLPADTSSHTDTQKDIRFVSAEGKQVQVWLSEEDNLGSAACVLFGYAIS